MSADCCRTTTSPLPLSLPLPHFGPQLSGRFAVNLLQLFILNFIVAEHKLISLVLSSCGLRRIFIGLFNCILNATGDKHHVQPAQYVINELQRDLMTI